MINAQRTGGYISRRRKTKDWTQLDLAEKLHVAHQAVSQWEKGAAFPDVGLLPRLAETTHSFEALEDLAPFLRRETLADLALRLGRAGRPLRPEHVATLAPFLDPAALDELIARLPGGPVPIEHVVEIAPFAGRATLDRLLGRLDDPAQLGKHLEDLAPFISPDALQDALASLEGGLAADVLLACAPFLGRETLDELLRANG